MAAMRNTMKRFIFGLTSSLLLTVGFVRAAEQLEPMAKDIPALDSAVNGTSPDCVT